MEDLGVLIFLLLQKKSRFFLLGKADAFHKIVHSINPLVSYWRSIYFDGDIFVIPSKYGFGGLMLGEQME